MNYELLWQSLLKMPTGTEFIITQSDGAINLVRAQEKYPDGRRVGNVFQIRRDAYFPIYYKQEEEALTSQLEKFHPMNRHEKEQERQPRRLEDKGVVKTPQPDANEVVRRLEERIEALEKEATEDKHKDAGSKPNY